ncbi:MAG: proprotein convertase P-domain-containing protein [Deltaproteobacteria bacterium]
MKNYLQNFLKFFIFLVFAGIIINGFAEKRDIKAKKADGTLACNDTVQIIMNWTCNSTVYPDQLLEGNYPDYDIFEVNIIDNNGESIGNTLSGEYVGMTLLAEVIDTETLNKCWSRIQIKDNYAPILDCDTLFTTCVVNPLPGSFLPKNYRFEFNPDTPIPDNDTLFMDFNVGNVPGAFITDLDFRLKIEHPRSLDLQAFLVSPANDTVWLMNNLTCGDANFDVTFDDQAQKTAADLAGECCACDPCIKGRFRAVENLSAFNGEIPVGDWRLAVIDRNANYSGTLLKAEILFKQNGGKITFPIPPTSSVPVLTGDKTYLVESGFDPCGSVELSYIDSIETKECSTGLSAVIKRKWKAVDESGNASHCTQVINVINTGMAFLTFPHDYNDIDYPALSCNPSNPTFYPTPAVTGYPGTELCSMVNYSYTDIGDTICSGSFKILRQWKVSDMCSGEVIEHYQLIIVEDKTPPVLANIADKFVSAKGHNCYADITVDMPQILAECSDLQSITYSVGYQEHDESGNPITTYPINTNLYKISNTRYVLRDAPVGKYKFTYTVVDDCGNLAQTSSYVTVVDDVPPVAVCDQHTQVVISVDGTAKVTALTFDDGSHDNCSELDYKVRRMQTNCVLSDTLYRDTITFCCNDINTTQMVVLKVTDDKGLFNTCMVQAIVVEKIPPVIKCPKNITISCHDDYKNLTLTGIATAYDNCEIDTLYKVDYININQCQTGTVNRNWIARDNNNHQSSCTQVITIKDFGQFKPSDIIWPKDVVLNDCSAKTDTASVGGIRFKNEDFCNMVSARYSDEVYNIVPGACKKILRKWEVIDWCNFNENNPDASTYRYTQVILIQDFGAPVFVTPCQNRSFCSYGPCEGDIEYIKTASDICTPENQLKWQYRVDLDNNGTWDIGPVLSNNASGKYKNGTHRFAWKVEDGCGNESVCEELITVKDCKKPTPLCITELTTVVMNHVGMATICARSFNLGQNCSNCNTGSYDNCTPKYKLKYSFSTNVNDTCRTFTCLDIPNGESTIITLDMWVTDEAGNQDYCTVYLSLQDNEADACPETTVGSLVFGEITDPGSKPMHNVNLNLVPEDGAYLKYTTGNNGKYRFENVKPENNYNLSPELKSDYLLGVSTLDLVLIQKHILGIKAFDEGYKFIAADVNRSRSITAADILRIRKAILGEANDFGTSDNAWTFVPDKPELLENPNILLEWEDNMTMTLNDYNKNIDWMGIKYGDINNSNNYSLMAGNLEPRNSEVIEISAEDKVFRQNENIEIAFRVNRINDLTGAQFTLNFDTDKLEFVSAVTEGGIVDKNDIGTVFAINGKLVVSWIKPENTGEENKMFSLRFRAKASGNLSESIFINNDIAASEAYSLDYEVMDIKLNFRNDSGYSLYQNIPNPFLNETRIYFDMPSAGSAEFEFFDLTGKSVKRQKANYSEGLNYIDVRFDEDINGVIYYRLQTNDYTRTMKMIKIK